MLRFLCALLIPTIAYAAVQCYVGQKLFSYESNNVSSVPMSKSLPQFLAQRIFNFRLSVPDLFLTIALRSANGARTVRLMPHSQLFMGGELSSPVYSSAPNR